LRSKDAEPLAVGGGDAERDSRRGVGRGCLVAGEGAAGGEVGIAQSRQFVAGRWADSDRGERLLGVAAVDLELLLGHRGEE
jgi:hypothetical protein